jgi:hypothetical protein
MRPELAAQANAIELAELVRAAGIEIAILQADVDVAGHRHTNTGEQLPGEPCRRVGQVDDLAASRIACRVSANRFLDPGNADTAADEALKAIIRPEIEQAVGHEAQRLAAAAQFVRVSVVQGGATGDVELVLFGATVGRFRFETERTEVIADDAAKVVT